MNAGLHITPHIKLVRKIGQGAMGEVWLAEQLALGTHVAVKLMGPGIADDERALMRFRQEAQAAARIDSQHVTHVYDAGTTEKGQPFIVMELLKGETLRDRMKRGGQLPITDVLWIVGQTAKGLGAAHKLGIWHRDIKPDNLFVLDHEGEPFVKILDFGIAKQSGGNFDMSSTGMAMGTPSYMSPQQFGDSKRVDHRADLWSLGIVTYEALTGRKPFHGLDLMTLSLSVSRGLFKAPSLCRAELPKTVDEWMLRVLAPELENRFTSAKEMADAFVAAVHRPVEPRGKSYAPPSSGDAAAFAPTIVAAPVSSKFAQAGDKPRGARNDPNRENQRPSRPPAIAPHEDPAIVITESPTRGSFSLSSTPAWIRSICFSDNGDSLFASFGGGEVLCLDIATRKPRWWQRVFSRTYCLVSGPSVLAVGCGDGTVRLLDVAHGNILKTIECHDGPVRGISLRRNVLVTAGQDMRLALWNVRTMERIQSGGEHKERLYGVAFGTPVGHIATGGRQGTVTIWDSTLQHVRAFETSKGTVRDVAFSPDGWFLASACADGRVRMWETRTWTLAQTMENDRKPVISVVFDPHSQVLAAGSSNGTIRFWHALTGRLQHTLPGRDKSVVRLAMAPDKRYFAVAYADGMINVFRWPLDPRLSDKPREE